MNKLKMELEGDTVIIARRHFDAEPELVYRAHTEPEWIQRWMLGPEGWTMPVCICEAKPGGTLRFEWSDGRGGGFHLTGEYVELEPFRRLVHVERMHLPNPTPDNHVETRFEGDGKGGTNLIVRMTLSGPEVRDAMLASGMEDGMEASYVRLDDILRSPENANAS